MTKNNHDRKLPTLQALRGVAASLVVFHHFASLFQGVGLRRSWIYESGLGNVGMSGVDIFFVISGFIMIYTSREKAGASDAVTFMKRRALRIYPLYWVWTSLLLILWLTGFAERLRHYSLSYLVKSFVLLPSFNGRSFHPMLEPGWTLAFEMLFYLVFSLAICLKIVSKRLVFLVAAFSGIALFSQVLPVASGLRYLFTDPIIVEFVYGVLIAEVLLRLPGTRANRFAWTSPTAFISLGVVALLSTIWMDKPDLYRFIFYGIPAIFIVLGAAMRGSAPAPRLLTYLGDCSFSIYLTHIFFALAYASALKRLPALSSINPDLSIVVAATITIALCSATYPLVERRLMEAISSAKLPILAGEIQRPLPSSASR